MGEGQNKVVGIRYEPGQGLPTVVLKGAGPLAEEVLRRGEDRSVPVVRNPGLVRELYRLPIDGEIGPELFELTALVLAHVLAVEESLKEESRWPTRSSR